MKVFVQWSLNKSINGAISRLSSHNDCNLPNNDDSKADQADNDVNHVNNETYINDNNDDCNDYDDNDDNICYIII